MKKIRMICLGAGSRGMYAYTPYALAKPDELAFVAIAEPIEARRNAFGEKMGVPEERRFHDWHDALNAGIEADAVFVALQDNEHVEPACLAMEKGYDVLLEKPIAKTESECRKLVDTARRTGRKASVCHVLRYTRFFRDIKAVIDSGAIGDICCVAHSENFGYWHMAHSYVRGNWRREDETSPLILAKSCHDTDILLYLIGKRCLKVASFGGLKHFKAENAPDGSAERCLDCRIKDCPYDARRLYLDPGITGWPVSVIADELTMENRVKALREGPYGRCVYHCDNDVVDHQSTILDFEDGITATMTVSGLTDYRHGRTLHIMGSHGEIRAKMSDETIEVTDFRTGSVKTYERPAISGMDGHSGGDWGLIEAFVKMEQGDEQAMISSAADAVASHMICIAAEESRHTGRVCNVKQL